MKTGERPQRMTWNQLAARMLTSDVVSVGQAASAVGYQSEAAFNRAFKRQVGETPGAWRRGRRAATSPGS